MNLFSANKVFVIAEMANSHEGNLLKAKKITAYASEAGADAIKFQKFTPKELAEPDHEYYDLYKKLEMSNKEWKELVTYAKSKNLKVFVDVFGVNSAKEISQLDIDGYKIHSSDLSNPFLLEFLANEKKSILLSTAGCLLNEIDEALKILLKTGKEIVLMHGFQGYPTNPDDLNLLRMSELKKKYGLSVGLMDHVAGGSRAALIIPLLGISLGAIVIEKHITIDRSKKGLDYYSALNPDEFKDLVSLIRTTEISLGTNNFSLLDNELKYRLTHKKNTISKRFIKKGTKLNEKMFEYKRTKTKQPSVLFYDFKGKLAAKDIKKGTILTNSMLDNKQKKIAAIIACRVDSARLFAKPLQLVGKYRILQLVLNQLKKSKLINDIVLAISENPGNEIFINFAKEQKVKFILGDDTDVLKRLIDAAKYVNADIVFRLTPENPYIAWEEIDPVIKDHLSGNFDFSFVDGIPLGSGFEIINIQALEISHKLGGPKHRSELCSLYINEHQKKFKINRYKPEKALQRPELRLTVDTPEDLMVARIINDHIGKDGKPISLKKIIKFLDANPKVTTINSGMPIGVSRIWN